ncbi:MAG TPA: bifunctional diaminohydroxyphosphoribosylaminopyrimidine deaminase/5-amino-6-(5-phosphoribosylamino)uracil reductase RibD [Longimicrobiales bacterium]|nr:bifunctional diaminohydroxyphosphoribosylaminopyrimidine deaminase/5-amino-6-(5-phosphoribosylamino)uracil reductase RibD [Longimicrobiales bacterium]
MDASSTGRDGLSGFDRAMLERARGLRLGGRGRAHPNPMVGCVLARDGRAIATGWHAEYGGAHAEVAALRNAGDEARGATAYVSLEPCAHFGQTPPCTEALVDAGIARVVYGAADPGGESGGGGAALAEAGIEVLGPCLTSHEALADNPAFFHRARTGRPYVAAKLAMSLDGRIARRAGERSTVTGPEAHAEVHRLRADHDAIVVGGRTALVDDPLLTVRGDASPRTPPIRVVLDPAAELGLDSRLVGTVDEAPVWLFCGETVSEARIEAFERAGVSVHPVPAEGDELDLDIVIGRCADLGVTSLLCEGGGRLVSGLLHAGLLDRLYLFVAPRVLGSDGVPAFPAEWPRGGPGPAAASDWTGVTDPVRFGDDMLAVWDRLGTPPDREED